MAGRLITNIVRNSRNLFQDYADVTTDVLKYTKDSPKKVAALLAGTTCAFYAALSNPDERSFRDRHLEWMHEYIRTGYSEQGEVAGRHLVNVERFYNKGQLRLLNFAFISVMWKDGFDGGCGLYEARCEYLKPNALEFGNRIVDVGFWGRWWLLERKMSGYDICSNCT